MTVSVDRFRKAFPEFNETSAILVQQKLDAAELRIARGTWGDLADQGVMYLAASLLSSAPEGQLARLQKEDMYNTYQIEWDRMKREVTIGVGRVS